MSKAILAGNAPPACSAITSLARKARGALVVEPAGEFCEAAFGAESCPAARPNKEEEEKTKRARPERKQRKTHFDMRGPPSSNHPHPRARATAFPVTFV